MTAENSSASDVHLKLARVGARESVDSESETKPAVRTKETRGLGTPSPLTTCIWHAQTAAQSPDFGGTFLNLKFIYPDRDAAH